MTHPILNMIDELDSGRDNLGGYITQLVEQIESRQRYRDLYRRCADTQLVTPGQRARFNEIAAEFDDRAEAARAELRALIGCDPYRLANAIGV